MQNYFTGALAVTAVGLVLCAVLGWTTERTLSGLLSFLFIGSVLAVLEISLSFDNAIVNANRLKHMSPTWRRRFLTWGILIAVFGMRIVFPLLVIVVAARLGPWEALVLAATDGARYAEIMHDAHISISAFGGAFLLLVALSYFFDEHKDIHWLIRLEVPMSRAAAIRGVEVTVGLAVVVTFAQLVPDAHGAEFLLAGTAGLLTFLVVTALGEYLDSTGSTSDAVAKSGLGGFMYLEFLDASFSFDGVIGAFALSNNMFIIAIGLGIGAMYVRSMTIMLVERKALAEYRFIEHGAFYAILVLSAIMFVQALIHVPEVITGLLGAGLIALSFWSSLRWKGE